MQIAVFGVGQLGTKLGLFLKKAEMSFAFIDNNVALHDMRYLGVKIWSPAEFYVINRTSLTVIACGKKHREEIEKQLASYGLDAGKDYLYYDTFINNVLPKLIYERDKKNFIGICQITLTERCTLKCKKCAHGCYAVESSSEDMSLVDVYKSADIFFSHFDLVYEFVLIGGEPMLYKEIDKVILYIGERYREQIGSFLITTNGTIIPDQKLIDMCKKYDVIFDISNYSHTLPRLQKKYSELTDTLERSEAKYSFNDSVREWIDYGFETVNRNASTEELKRVFRACRTPCHEIRGNRLYYCVMARSVSDNLHFDVGKDDYLDLDTQEGEKGKETLLKFTLGEFEKGYLDMCNYCRGAEAVNYPIAAAEQMQTSKQNSIIST